MTRFSGIDNLTIFKCLGKTGIDPDATACIFVNDDGSEEVLTYGRIFENTNRLSNCLVKAGIGKGDAFALLMKNNPEFLYSMFAAVSLGAIVVPIDPRSRGKKLAFQINNVKSRGIISGDDFIENIKEIEKDIAGIPVIGISYKKHHGVPISDHYPSLNDFLENESPDFPDAIEEVDPGAPAQIIHTSGTTGDPKGVVLKVDRFMIYGFFADLLWKYRDDDVLYTGLSMTHGNAQSVTLFPALTKGIPAVISERFTKSRIWDICRTYGCTSFSLLGGMMSGIYNEPVKDNDGDNPVRKVISAGTPRAIWEAFEKRFDLKIHEWYAAIEGGLAHNPPGEGPVGSFGKALELFMEMKIVDEDDNEVPAGEKGELVSRMKTGDTEVNYVGREEESKDKTRGGWLRSGDICHCDEQGFLYFDYRKGGGLRRQGDFIQPDYIEKIIGEQDSISEVCVYGIPAESGAPGESDIVAAIKPFDKNAFNAHDIRDLCISKLEKNSVPSYIQIVDEIPKTISEKPLERILKENFDPESDTVIAL